MPTQSRTTSSARRSKAKTAKLDLYAKHKNEYVAGRTPALVRVGPAKYLSYADKGTPGGPEFTRGVGALYNVAFTIKMAKKAAGSDYTVTRLEGLWSPDPRAAPGDSPWNWQLLIRVPTFVTERDLTAALAALRSRNKSADVERVQLISIREGECVQILHVGPWNAEQESIAKMREFAAKAGRTFAGKHHEIYLSDPARVEPARLKTILRQPVA